MLNRIYGHDEILSVADFPKLIKKMTQTLRQDFCTQINVPEKSIILRENPFSAFLSMPAYSEHLGLYISKIASFFQRPEGNNLPTIQAQLIAFSSRTGEPLALLDGNAITKIKCAAISAVVTDYCAVPEADTIAIIGSGVQAMQQYIGVSAVRDIKNIHVYSRTSKNRDSFIKEIQEISKHTMPRKKVTVAAFNSVEEVIIGAQIVATTTSSKQPLAQFNNLSKTVHVNAMGAHTPESRELPHNILKNSILIVEDQATAIKEAGDIHRNAHEVTQLHNLSVDTLQNDQTIFSSTGFALLDLIVTAHILEKLIPDYNQITEG